MGEKNDQNDPTNLDQAFSYQSKQSICRESLNYYYDITMIPKERQQKTIMYLRSRSEYYKYIEYTCMESAVQNVCVNGKERKKS